MKRINRIYETKKVGGAVWLIALLKTGEKAIYKDEILQRRFSDYGGAKAIFEIWINR